MDQGQGKHNRVGREAHGAPETALGSRPNLTCSSSGSRGEKVLGTDHCAPTSREEEPDSTDQGATTSSWGSNEVKTTGQARLQLKAMSTLPQLLSWVPQHPSTKVPKAASSYSALQKWPTSGLIPNPSRHTTLIL